MDKKTLLAKATEKLDRRTAAPEPARMIPPEPSSPPPKAGGEGTERVSAAPRAEKRQGTAPVAEVTAEDQAEGVEPVVKKGITLRPSNIRKLDVLELALRNRGLKSSHSALIQIAIDGLEDGPQLEMECRRLLAEDLRFRESAATATPRRR